VNPATTWQASLPAAVAVVPSSSSAGCRGELRVVRVAARAHKMGRGHALRRAQRIAKASAISQRLGKAQATDVVSVVAYDTYPPSITLRHTLARLWAHEVPPIDVEYFTVNA
jgi:hypothetical protein